MINLDYTSRTPIYEQIIKEVERYLKTQKLIVWSERFIVSLSYVW